MLKITRAQREALYGVYCRRPLEVSYREFRQSAAIAFGDCLMVEWQGMLLGIETDGHVHS